MNKDIQEKLIEWTENIGNLAATELPEFIREITTYGFVSNLIWAIILIPLCVFFGVIAYGLFKEVSERKLVENDGPFIGGIILSTLCFFVGVYAICCLNSASKAFFAPRLYVIQTIRGE